MLEAILVIFACQLSGEAASRGLGLPLPGPVVGMAILFTWLQFRAWKWPSGEPLATSSIGIVAGFLLAHLSLLFVPAGTGIVNYLPVLTAHGVGLVLALVISTALSLAVTSLVFAALAKRFDRPEKP